jgi:multiple sugar transport system ATP-binding protein
MIYVTHDQVEAMTMGDRIAVFNQGRVEQLGAPLDLYARPANEFVATFLGAPRINLIARPAPGAAAQHAVLWQAVAAQAGPSVNKIGIRPEHLQIVAPQEGVAAQVMLAEHLGDASILHLRVEGLDELLTAKVAAQPVLAGQWVGLSFDLGQALAFSVDGALLAV